ncbi:integrase [Bradyrhizobium niftali]|uniref:tyrosine-type recombinase/integrase n=1 Tax=Bradyrhizobium niftali TaxID=2560055 RepID=UPI0038370876
MALTDAACRAAKKAAKAYKLTDAGGLFLLVDPGGSRLWRHAYRFGGKQKTIALGVYPHVGLAAAREARDANKRMLAAGTDPSEKRKADKQAAAVAHLTTFDRIADDWLEDQRSLTGGLDAPKDQRKKSPETIEKLDWLLSLVRPQLGKLDARTLTTAQIVDALDRIGARGQRDTAHRCRATVSRVLARAARRGAIPVNPLGDTRNGDITIRGAKAVQHHASVTDAREGDRDGDAARRFGKLLRDVRGYHGASQTRLALELLALTVLRPGELRRLRWTWVDADSVEPVISLPPSLIKMRKSHTVHLSRQAVALLQELRQLTGWTAESAERVTAGADFLLPCQQPRRTVGKDGQPVKRSRYRPLSESAMNSALRRLGYANSDHVGHGFRSAFSTLANEAHAARADVIETALNHMDEDAVRGTYNDAAYHEQRRRLSQWWADYLDELRGLGRVVQLRA